MEVFLNVFVAIAVKTMNDNTLIQNFIPNFKPKVFFAMRYWIRHVENCTQRLVNAAPCALKTGMNMRFNVILIITPRAATKFLLF